MEEWKLETGFSLLLLLAAPKEKSFFVNFLSFPPSEPESIEALVETERPRPKKLLSRAFKVEVSGVPTLAQVGKSWWILSLAGGLLNDKFHALSRWSFSKQQLVDSANGRLVKFEAPSTLTLLSSSGSSAEAFGSGETRYDSYLYSRKGWFRSQQPTENGLRSKTAKRNLAFLLRSLLQD